LEVRFGVSVISSVELVFALDEPALEDAETALEVCELVFAAETPEIGIETAVNTAKTANMNAAAFFFKRIPPLMLV